MKNLKIFHICKKCKIKIPTFLDEGELSGNFIVLDVIFSELLNKFVHNPNEILCLKCHFNF